MRSDLWITLLAFNAGLLLVLILRPLWLRQFGARASYQLWLLPLLAALATLLPQGPAAWYPLKIPLDRTLPALGTFAIASPAVGPAWPWALWIGGALATIGYFAAVRWRMHCRLRQAPREHQGVAGGLTVVRAEFGPALVGLLRPVLVLPQDFEQRYTPRQQALVIAHERAHHRAGDLWIRTLALLLVAAQWFNPLAWWALRRLIEDQECACDARVLAQHPFDTPDYARALAAAFTTSPASNALVCSMHPQHPLLRRIAMLNRTPDSPSRKIAARMLTLGALIAASALAWAGGGRSAGASAGDPDFRIGFEVQIDEGPVQAFALGVRASEEASATIDDDAGRIELKVAADRTGSANQTFLRLVLLRDGIEIARPAVIVNQNGDARIEVGESTPDGFRGLRMDVSVTEPAELIDMAPAASNARALANDVARRAGITLEGVELLPESPVEARFDGIQAESVLELLAHSHGLTTSREGDTVRFEAY